MTGQNYIVGLDTVNEQWKDQGRGNDARSDSAKALIDKEWRADSEDAWGDDFLGVNGAKRRLHEEIDS